MGLLTDRDINLRPLDAVLLFRYNNSDLAGEPVDRLPMKIMKWLDEEPNQWVKESMIGLLMPIPCPEHDHLTRDQALDMALIEKALDTSGPGPFDIGCFNRDMDLGDMCMHMYDSNTRFTPFVDSASWNVKRMYMTEMKGLVFPSLSFHMNITGNIRYELVKGSDIMAGRNLCFQTTICAATINISLKSELFEHKFTDHGTTDR